MIGRDKHKGVISVNCNCTGSLLDDAMVLMPRQSNDTGVPLDDHVPTAWTLRVRECSKCYGQQPGTSIHGIGRCRRPFRVIRRNSFTEKQRRDRYLPRRKLTWEAQGIDLGQSILARTMEAIRKHRICSIEQPTQQYFAKRFLKICFLRQIPSIHIFRVFKLKDRYFLYRHFTHQR